MRWEISGGVSLYPSHTRSWRLNLHLIKVEKSPAASNFGFYTSGQSGTTISIGLSMSAGMRQPCPPVDVTMRCGPSIS